MNYYILIWWSRYKIFDSSTKMVYSQTKNIFSNFDFVNRITFVYLVFTYKKFISIITIEIDSLWNINFFYGFFFSNK